MSSRDDKELTGRQAIEEIDRRLGGLLGPLAEGLARIVDAAEKAQSETGGSQPGRSETGRSETGHRAEAGAETARGPVKLRTGLSVNLGGLAAARPGANAADAGARSAAHGAPRSAYQSGPRTAPRDPARPVADPGPSSGPNSGPSSGPTAQSHAAGSFAEPHHDVFESETTWSLAAELPGAAEADLVVTLDAGRLSVETTGARRWRLTVAVPAWVDRGSLTQRLSNGILDLAAERGDAS